MPMLATVIASTTTKPSMTLPRNRSVGSFTDIDRGQARFDNPTSNPRLLPKNQQNRERELPDLLLKIRAEWIRAGKFASEPHSQSARRQGRACPGHDWTANKAPNFINCIRPCVREWKPRYRSESHCTDAWDPPVRRHGG